jgi:hypothetical protein
MKKIIIAAIAVLCLSNYAKADTTPAVVFPTSAQNAYLGNQVIVTIINHGTFTEEYRKGLKQLILSDNIIEAGHLNGQYIVALDGSLYQKTGATKLDYEAGIRLNLHAIVNRYVTLTPQYQAILGNLEYYPRVGYDFGQDRAHGWIATFNLGLGFGPGAGISQ